MLCQTLTLQPSPDSRFFHLFLRLTQYLDLYFPGVCHSPRPPYTLTKPRLLLPCWLITNVFPSVRLIPLHLFLNLTRLIVDLPSPSTTPTQCSPFIIHSPNPRRNYSFKKIRDGMTLHFLPTNLSFLHTNHNLCK